MNSLRLQGVQRLTSGLFVQIDPVDNRQFVRELQTENNPVFERGTKCSLALRQGFTEGDDTRALRNATCQVVSQLTAWEREGCSPISGIPGSHLS